MVERRVQVVRNRNNAEEAKVERSIRALVDKKNKDDNERLIKARNAGSGGLDGMDEDDDDDSNEDEENADGDVVDILQERIGNLTKVLQVNGYKSVLQSADDDGAELNDHQKWHIGQKAIYLREAYKQVLWERGFIDTRKPYSHYQVEKKVDGKVVEDISLRHMMGKCTDFAEEVSQLEAIG
ncbi:hypothetical protein THAOC_26779, partial [Thalassiosira oceanica]